MARWLGGLVVLEATISAQLHRERQLAKTWSEGALGTWAPQTAAALLFCIDWLSEVLT